MKNMTAKVEGNELVIRARLDSPLGERVSEKTGEVTSYPLAQSDFLEQVQVGDMTIGFKASVWLVNPNKTTKSTLRPVSDEAKNITAALLAKVAKK